MSPETEGGTGSRLKVGKASPLRPDDVQSELDQLRVHAGGLQRRRCPALTQRHDGQHRLQPTGPAQEVAGGGLRGADGRRRQAPGQDAGLDDVTGRGRGGMGVDVPDPPGIKVRPLQCQAQSAFLLRARRLSRWHGR